MRKSSRGNPWHDSLGRFCHGPTATVDTWGNDITDKQRQESVCCSVHDDEYYYQRTLNRIDTSEKEKQKLKEFYGVGKPEDEPSIKRIQTVQNIEKELKIPAPKEKTNRAYQKYIEEHIKEYYKSIYKTTKKSDLPPFKECKTIKEATAYAESLGVRAFYKGVDIRTANAMNLSVHDAFENFPSLRKEIRVIGNAQEVNKEYKKDLTSVYQQLYKENYPFMYDSEIKDYAKSAASKMAGRVSGRTYAFARYNTGCGDYRVQEVAKAYNGICINKEYSSDYEKMENSVKRNVENKFHPDGTGSVKSIVDHEVGHFIDFTYGLKPHFQDEFRKTRKNEIKEKLSAYAGENVGEFIAEGYAEYINNPNPRETATMIGKKCDEFKGK